MKKLNITIALVLFLSFSAFASGNYSTLFFKTLDGIQLYINVYAEEEVDEALPLYDNNESVLSSHKPAITLSGETFDLSGISIPEEEIEETIDTQAIFREYAGTLDI